MLRPQKNKKIIPLLRPLQDGDSSYKSASPTYDIEELLNKKSSYELLSEEETYKNLSATAVSSLLEGLNSGELLNLARSRRTEKGSRDIKEVIHYIRANSKVNRVTELALSNDAKID